MEFSSLTSLFEIFVGISLASSLIDNFSVKIYNQVISGRIDYRVYIYKETLSSYQKKLNEIRPPKLTEYNEEIIPLYDEYFRINDRISSSTSNIDYYTKKTKKSYYFKECSFLSFLYSISILLIIAINKSFNNFELTFIFIFTVFILVGNLFFSIKEFLAKKHPITFVPINFAIIIFVIIVCLTCFLSDFYIKSDFLQFEIKRTYLFILMIATPIIQFPIYFFKSHFYTEKINELKPKLLIQISEIENEIIEYENKIRPHLS